MDEDKVIEFVKDACAGYQSVHKAWLFGSRLHGTSGPTSDYDFAFMWHETNQENWGQFTAFLRESNPTLYSMDLVRLDMAKNSLKSNITVEGQIIYDKDAAKNRKSGKGARKS